MKKTIAALFLLVSFLALTACGGGGGSGGGSNDPTPTDPNQTFDLSKLNTTTPGTVYSTQLTGSDSEGNTFSGSISFANRAQVMLDGILVTPGEVLISLTGRGTSFTVTSTGYTDTSGNLISLVTQTTGLACTPVSPDSAPTLVKIGDFGIRSTLICNDDTTYNMNWRVEGAGDGAINYIVTATIKDQFNTVATTASVTYTISASGEILAFKTVSNIVAENYTLTYKSK